MKKAKGDRAGKPAGEGDNEKQPDLEEARRQFLVNVFGYADPPSVWELAQLAAMIGGKIPANRPGQSADEAERSVELARDIWDSAGRVRKEMQKRLDKVRKDFDARMPFYGPLKIGSHFLPRITQWDEVDGKVPFKRYLEQVIGMAREEDRARWWRAYITAKIRMDTHAERWGYRDKDEHRESPEWCEPEDFPIDDNAVPEAIEHQRTRGFDIGFTASYFLEEFRTWRLGMKTPTKKADSPVSLEDAVRNGLEAENAAES